MSLKRNCVPVFAGALAIFAAGCGSGLLGNVGGELTPNFVTGAGTAAGMFLTMNDQVQTLAAPSAEEGPFVGIGGVSGANLAGLISARSATDAGQAFSGGLKSLKYFVQNIQLCESLDTTGSAYNNPSGCIYIYRNPGISASESSSTSFYDTYTATAALADGAASTRFSDLMTSAGLASLRRPLRVDSSMVGTYNYGLINFMRVIKATADFKGSDGTVLYRTRANASVYRTGTDGSRQVEYVKVGDTTTATPAQETTYMLNNGGTFFRFNQPFQITSQDVSDRSDLKIDLVFNPENFGSATRNGGNCVVGADPGSGVDGNGSPVIYDDTNCVGITFPFAKLNPVPRKGTQRTHKEVYRLANFYTGGMPTANVRIELYYNDGDPAKSIQGIDVATELAGASTALPVGAPFYTYSATEASNVVTFRSYDGTSSVTNLTRRTGGTANVVCMLPDTATGCSATGATVSKAYTYVGDYVVSSD